MSIDQSVLDKFEAVVESQRKRIMDMKAQDDFIDYSKLDKLIIGVCGGDGIGSPECRCKGEQLCNR